MLVVLAGCGGTDDGATDDTPAGPTPDPGPLPTSSIPTVGTAKQLASLDGDVSALRMALDDRPSPTVYVSWNQRYNDSTDLYLTRFVDSNGFWDLQPVKLNSAAGSVAGAGEMVVDREGSVTAIWPEREGGRLKLWSSYHRFSERSWRQPESLGGDSSGSAGQPLMVVESGSRYVVAVWPQEGGTGGQLWANRYNVDPGGGWEGASAIDAGGGGVAEVVVLIDQQDVTTAIWTQHDGSRYNLWARRHDSGTGWGTAQQLDTEDLGDVSAPRAVLDGDGNMTLVWLQHNGSSNRLWAIRHEGGSWQSAVMIGEVEGMADPQLVVDGNGDVTVAWVQLSGSWSAVWAQRYWASGGGWSTPVNIGALVNGAVELALLSVDSARNVVAVWREEGERYRDLRANRYAVASGWGAAGVVENLNDGDAGLPVAGSDAIGRLTLVWRHRHEGGDHLVSSRYTPFSGSWGSVLKVEAATESGGEQALIVVDKGGDATTVWRQPTEDGLYSLWGNRF